jgi:lipopolysaccharide/colanic/teichoic acid biosynthesis glycosyltransferase
MSGHRKLRRWVLLADLAWLGLSMLVAWLFRYGFAWRSQPHVTAQAFVLAFLGSCLIWIVLSSSLDISGGRVGWRIPAIISHLLLTVGMLMATLLAAAFLSRIYFSRLAIGYFFFVTLTGFILIRLLTRNALHAHNHGGAVRRIAVVGNGPVAHETAARFAQHPELRSKVVGFLSPDDTACLTPAAAPIGVALVSACSVVDTLRNLNVDELVFASSRNADPRVAELMEQCAKSGIEISVVPQPYELYLSVPELVDLDGIPILRLRNSLWCAKERPWKRIMDVTFAVPLSLLSLPIILGAALVLKIHKGTGFCREERYGLHGRRFWICRLNSPRKGNNLPAYERILQHLSVTELPQLWNVLRGEMSLVGPRPEGFESVRHYTDWHRQRLNVNPGITGLAQVHGLRDHHALAEKTRYDLQYILHRSLFQDISLLLQTLWTLVGRLGRLRRLQQEPVHGSASSSLAA